MQILPNYRDYWLFANGTHDRVLTVYFFHTVVFLPLSIQNLASKRKRNGSNRNTKRNNKRVSFYNLRFQHNLRSGFNLAISRALLRRTLTHCAKNSFICSSYLQICEKNFCTYSKCYKNANKTLSCCHLNSFHYRKS